MKTFMILLSFLFISVSALAQTIPNEIILKTATSESQIIRKVNASDPDISKVELKLLSKTLDIYLLKATTISGNNASENIVAYLNKIDLVEYAYPNMYTQQRATPSDPKYADQWNLDLINATNAWEVTTGGEDLNGNEIVIAILDDGFDLDHEDFQANIWINDHEIANDGIDNDNNGYRDDIHGIDLDSKNGDIDIESHGTSVTGIVGADSNNDIGIAGINWNVKLMLLSSVTEEDKVIEAYEYVYTQRKRYNESNGEQGSYIVATNYSLGIDNEFGEDHPMWCEMYDLLGSIGIISVGATTNSNINVDLQGDLPTTCSSPYFIGVTNSDRNDVKVINAGYGLQHIDLSAPGKGPLSIIPNNGYTTFAGTSASAPHVTGALGLIYSLKCINLNAFIKESPSEAALRIKEAILNGTNPLPSLAGKTSTGGRLNILNAISDLSGYCGSDTTEDIRGKLSINKIKRTNNEEHTIFYITEDINPVKIRIFDMQGRQVFSILDTPNVYSPSNVSFDLGGLATGIYIITITSNDELISKKLFHSGL